MLLLIASLAHVPAYDNACAHGCCHAPHPRNLDISQATYLRGSGGVEVDVTDLANRIESDSPIEYSVVFKREYDVSTYELYVGCGGCASERSKGEGEGWDTPNTSNLLYTSNRYQPGVLEAFTQHPYFPLVPHGPARFYNVSQLKGCTTHWSVRLVTHDNASEDMAWSVALGCEDGLQCEQFTATERFLFPLYQIRNHGAAWNDLGFTLPVVAAALLLVYATFLRCAFSDWGVYVPVALVQPQRENLACVAWEGSLRCVVYATIVYAVLVDILESGVHMLVSLRVLHDAEAPYNGDGLGIFFGLVLGVFKLLPLAFVLWSWMQARTTPEFVWRTSPFRCKCSRYHGIGVHSPFWAHGAWSIPETTLGIVSLLYLGASGYWVLGVGLILSGLLRLVWWLANPNRIFPGEQLHLTNSRWSSLKWTCSLETREELLELYSQYYRSHRTPLLKDYDAPNP